MGLFDNVFNFSNPSKTFSNPNKALPGSDPAGILSSGGGGGNKSAKKAAVTPITNPNGTDPKVFNPDGSLVSPVNARKNKTYRAIRNVALGLQDFLPTITSAQTKATTSSAPILAQSQFDIFNKFNSMFAGYQANTDLV